jgi:hypothetical protein
MLGQQQAKRMLQQNQQPAAVASSLHQLQLHTMLFAQLQQCVHIAAVQLFNAFTNLMSNRLQDRQRQQDTHW